MVVMDFGLARSMEASGMTQAGAIMGTPAYMSPEQARGMPADERSDIFALGIILYQMLTGGGAIQGENGARQSAVAHARSSTRAIKVDPTIPQPLSNIVLKALATDPANRYQKAAELGKDLHDWQEGVVHQRIVTPPSR